MRRAALPAGGCLQQRPGPGNGGQASRPPLAAFRATQRAAAKPLPGQPGSPLDEAVAEQALLKEVFADVNHREADAKGSSKNPKTALACSRKREKR